MLKKERHPIIFTLNILLFFFAIIFYGGGIDISIGHAYPFIILALLVAFSVFAKVSHAAVAGLISGAFIDSVSTGSYCFNSIALLLLAVGACLLSANVFNKNLKAVFALCFLSAVVYYLFYWLVFIAFSVKGNENIEYLLRYALPSALYTSFFAIPFYLIYKHWNKIKNG